MIDESQTKILTATVQYSLGGDIQNSDTVTLKKTVQVLSTDVNISTDGVSAKTYKDWKPDGITVNGKAVQELPDTVGKDSVIVYHYSKDTASPVAKEITVTAKYVDEENREIAAPKTLKVPEGEKYGTAPAAVKGYDLVSGSGNKEGTAGNSDITVIYTYKLQDASVTVNYVDENGKQVASPDTMPGKYGNSYEIAAKEIAGYDLVSDSGNTKGSMAGNIAVTYTYRIQEAVLAVRYVDNGTNKNILPEEVLHGKMFDKYETAAKDIEGYTLVKTPANAKGVLTSGKTTVTYRYIPDTAGENLPDAVVIAEYVDEEGNKIAASAVLTGKAGDAYATSPKEIDGYELVGSSGNEKGFMDGFTTIVTYTYKPAAGDKPEPEQPEEGGTLVVDGCPEDLLSVQVYNYNACPVKYNGKTFRPGALLSIVPVAPDHKAVLAGLPYGTYRVKEYRTKTGFSADKNYYTIKVEDGNHGGSTLPSPAQAGSIKLSGADNISLQGMEFTVRNIGPSVMYGGNIINAGGTVGVFTADNVDLMIDGLPYGVYELLQTGCGDKYHPDETVYTVNIVNSGTVEITVQVSNHEHKWSEGIITASPECTKTGVLTYTCEICGSTMTETVGKLGHSYYTKEPTCREEGYRRCTRCGDTVTLPKTEHNWDDGVLATTGVSSCETQATRLHTCRYCGERKI